MRISLREFTLMIFLSHAGISSAEPTLVGGIDSGGGISLITGQATLSTIGAVFSDSGLLPLLTPADPAPADLDENGMPDAWEALHGLTGGSGAGNIDTDGDGSSDLQEYLLGTNPRQAAPGPAPEFSKHPSKEGAGVIRFPTAPGRIYRIWSSPTLQPGSWTQMWTELGAGKTLQFETSNGGPTRFYKITVNLFR